MNIIRKLFQLFSRKKRNQNSFTKEEREAFEKMLAGFKDCMVLSENMKRMDRPSSDPKNTCLWKPSGYLKEIIKQNKTV